VAQFSEGEYGFNVLFPCQLVLPFNVVNTSRKAHRLAVTSAALSPSGTHLYTSSKDGAICKWDVLPWLSKPTKIASERKHKGEVFSIAVSGDSKRLASGGSDKQVGIWDISGEKLEWISGLGGHRDGIGVR
jgi:ribosomal RNA-processing protein 9